MEGYLAGVVIVLLATSVLAVWILNKYKLLKTSIVLETTASSFAVSIIFPSLYYSLGYWVIFLVIIIALILATIIYVANNYQDNGVQAILQSCAAIGAGYLSLGGFIRKKLKPEKFVLESQCSESILHTDETVDTFDNSYIIESVNVEKSVDSFELTDKMGLDICIQTAFEQKEAGDLEGAILYYMFALDKEPSKEDAFWILLDICAMYKELNQSNMAKEVLDNYSSVYEDIINEDIKNQIISNL